MTDSTVRYINTQRMKLEGEKTGPRHLVIEGVSLEKKREVVELLEGVGARIIDFPAEGSVRAVGLDDSQLRALAKAGVNYPEAANYQSPSVGACR